jgi:hypothetical protein
LISVITALASRGEPRLRNAPVDAEITKSSQPRRFYKLSLAKKPFGLNAFEISDFQDEKLIHANRTIKV